MGRLWHGCGQERQCHRSGNSVLLTWKAGETCQEIRCQNLGRSAKQARNIQLHYFGASLIRNKAMMTNRMFGIQTAMMGWREPLMANWAENCIKTI